MWLVAYLNKYVTSEVEIAKNIFTHIYNTFLAVFGEELYLVTMPFWLSTFPELSAGTTGARLQTLFGTRGTISWMARVLARVLTTAQSTSTGLATRPSFG